MRPFTAKYTRENIFGSRYLKHTSDRYLVPNDTNKPEVGDYLVRTYDDRAIIIVLIEPIIKVTAKTISVMTQHCDTYVDTPLEYKIVRLSRDTDGNLRNEKERMFYYQWMPKSYGDEYYNKYLAANDNL